MTLCKNAMCCVTLGILTFAAGCAPTGGESGAPAFRALQDDPLAALDAAPIPPQLDSIDTRAALVIGNQSYERLTPLETPQTDAERLAQRLTAMGFVVSRIGDADGNDMREQFDAWMQDNVESDLTLVFFAGHGVASGGDNWLLGTDATADESVEAAGLSLNRVLAELGQARGVDIVLVDACRTPAPNLPAGLALPDSNALDQIVAYSTSPGRVAFDDGRDGHSPFGWGLVRHITRPGLRVEDMLRLVRLDVANLTRGYQTPWSNSSLVNQVQLMPGDASPAARSALSRTSIWNVDGVRVRDFSPPKGFGKQLIVKADRDGVFVNIDGQESLLSWSELENPDGVGAYANPTGNDVYVWLARYPDDGAEIHMGYYDASENELGDWVDTGLRLPE